jgi:phosphoglycolate phosphatase
VNLDAIFFDLDGTLTDPKPGITRSIQYALHRLEQSTIPTEDQLTWCIGPPLRASFVKLLGEASADLAVALYRERFSEVGLYAELDGTRADKSDLLAHALRTTAVDPSRTLMIGDRSHDMVGAKNNGMKCIGVLYGYGSRDELIAAGARQLCAAPQAILDCIA